MKKLILLFLVTIFFGCATTKNTPVVPRHKYLTIEAVQQNCKQDKFWQVDAIGTPVLGVHYDKCLEIVNLLVILAPEVYDNSKLSADTVKLVSLYYLNYLNKNDKENQWTIKVLKVTVRGLDKKGPRSHIAFYSLSSSKRNN